MESADCCQLKRNHNQGICFGAKRTPPRVSNAWIRFQRWMGLQTACSWRGQAPARSCGVAGRGDGPQPQVGGTQTALTHPSLCSGPKRNPKSRSSLSSETSAPSVKKNLSCGTQHPLTLFLSLQVLLLPGVNPAPPAPDSSSIPSCNQGFQFNNDLHCWYQSTAQQTS